jgi:uncharacterized membrane protein YeaQ/YmgE (transglycosylase-associated protein family)
VPSRGSSCPAHRACPSRITILFGIVGSFVGGFLGFLVFRSNAGTGFLQPAGIIGSIIGAIIVLLICVKFGGGPNTSA